MDPVTHIDFLDAFYDSNDLIRKIELTYSDLIQTIQELDQSIKLQKNSSNQKELLQFQIQEIQAVDPQIDEDIELGKEFKRLNHVDELISTIQSLNQSLTEHDHSIYRQLASTLNELERLSKYDESLKPFIDSIDQATVSIQDASAGMIQHGESIEYDQKRLQEVEERLQAIESLKRKYGGSIELVRLFIQNSDQELTHLSGLDEKISELELEKTHLINRYQKLADQLNTLRMKFAEKVAVEIEMEMANLNMAGAIFQVQITQVEDRESFIKFDNKSVKYGSKGYDQVTFFLSANPGELPKPLIKIASGGEISRIMLAIKSVLKKSDPVDTLIFDEIDTGISGQAAEKVGEALKKLSHDKQVICITHLPQIASKADHHVFIHKKIKNEQTEVVARYLNNKEKIQAIAELFSGENMPKERIKSSQQFIDQARG